MREYTLENNLKLIYKQTVSKLTSISISLDAGAAVDGKCLGIAHATEHMVYKGTKKRNESEINKELSNIFGFQNAMTNYPYVIYYGTLLSEEFKEGVDIFSDIIINPLFNEEGFKEEMDVIIEELKEWDEEVEQYCEDKLFLNSFNNRRIKYPIIGTVKSLKTITLDNIKSFHREFYYPGNVSIAVVSSLEFEEVKDIIENYFSHWKSESSKNKIDTTIYEKHKPGIYMDFREGINTCKVEMIFSIDNLSIKEIKAFKVFNEYFGEGVNSVLYEKLRTENGIVYDVLTKIAYEKHIKLYKINFSTSKENLNRALVLVDECIDNLETYITKERIKQFIKTLKLKRLFREEQSIILAKELSTYDTMFGDYKIYNEELENLDEITVEFIIETAWKVLRDPSIEVICSRD